MVSLEKKMFLLPTKFVVKDSRAFIYFNLAPVPKDMSIVKSTLCIPVRKQSSPSTVFVKKIKTKWKESQIETGIMPKLSKIKNSVKCTSKLNEIVIDVTEFHNKSRKKSNYGIYVSSRDGKNRFRSDRTPYLVLETI